LLLPLALLAVAPLAACGGSSKPSSSATTPSSAAGSGTTVHVAVPVSANPSKSAKMICEKEAVTDIYEQATGVKTVAPLKPTWVNHVYSCDYVYPNGAKFTLSVKELANADETTAYFNSLADSLHKTKDVVIAQGAFQTANGSVVVRKDFKVLTVDVAKLPANFGVPSAPRGDVAQNVAATIMSCWTGA